LHAAEHLRESLREDCFVNRPMAVTKWSDWCGFVMRVCQIRPLLRRADARPNVERTVRDAL
jgi:hypothetical protein